MDQSDADDDLSAKQRLGLVAGSTIQGAAGFAGDIKPLADVMDVAGVWVICFQKHVGFGFWYLMCIYNTLPCSWHLFIIILSVGGVVKDQAEADTDASLKQRVALGIG